MQHKHHKHDTLIIVLNAVNSHFYSVCLYDLGAFPYTEDHTKRGWLNSRVKSRLLSLDLASEVEWHFSFHFHRLIHTTGASLKLVNYWSMKSAIKLTLRE